MSSPRRLAGVAVLLLSSCAGTSLPMYDAGEYGHLAATSGHLARDGPCLVLVSRGGGTIHLAWPSPGTEWNPQAATISVHGVTAALGEEITLGGGEGSGVRGDAPTTWLNPPAAACSDGTQWLVTEIQK